MLIKNTGINFAVRKIPYLSSGVKNTGINFAVRKIPYLFSGWKIPELKNTRFISTAPVHLYTGAVLRDNYPQLSPIVAGTHVHTCMPFD